MCIWGSTLDLLQISRGNRRVLRPVNPEPIGCLPYFHTWSGLSANLRCRSETCCTRLTGNAGRKKVAKNRHMGTIAQLCRAISSQLTKACIDNRKKLVTQRYFLHMSPQYGELRPTNGWDPSGSLRHPCKFQRVSRLGSVTAWHLVVGVSQTLRRWIEGAPVFGRATITLGIGPHSSVSLKCRRALVFTRKTNARQALRWNNR